MFISGKTTINRGDVLIRSILGLNRYKVQLRGQGQVENMNGLGKPKGYLLGIKQFYFLIRTGKLRRGRVLTVLLQRLVVEYHHSSYSTSRTTNPRRIDLVVCSPVDLGL